MDIKDYNQAIDYLNSFFNLENIPRYDYSRELKLKRMEDLLERFGNPQNSFKTVHITGSKGKGTVSAALFQILKESGFITDEQAAVFTKLLNGSFFEWGEQSRFLWSQEESRKVDSAYPCHITKELLKVLPPEALPRLAYSYNEHPHGSPVNVDKLLYSKLFKTFRK